MPHPTRRPNSLVFPGILLALAFTFGSVFGYLAIGVPRGRQIEQTAQANYRSGTATVAAVASATVMASIQFQNRLTGDLSVQDVLKFCVAGCDPDPKRFSAKTVNGYTYVVFNPQFENDCVQFAGANGEILVAHDLTDSPSVMSGNTITCQTAYLGRWIYNH